MNQHDINEYCKKEANKALEKILNAKPVSTTEIREPIIDPELVQKHKEKCLAWRGIYQRAFNKVMEQHQ